MFDPASNDRSWQDIKESSGVEDRDQIKYLANRNFRFFIEHVLGLNTNSPVIENSIQFHQDPEKFSETDEGTDAVKAAVMAPRGHSKTYSWTIAPILWIAYKDKGKQILLSSASNSQSKDILQDLKRMIERNEALSHLKPSTENLAELGSSVDIEDWEATWQKEEVTTTTDVRVKVKTFSDSIRSKHVDYVFLDDVLSKTMSKEEEKDVFYSVLGPIIENNDGVLQIVGTPIKYNDLLMELMEKDNFYTERYQAYDPETEQVLWPDNWTYEALREKRREIGPGRFAREYMCNPMSVDEQFFTDEMIEGSLGADWRHNPNASDRSDWRYALGVDVALSDSDDADYAVFTVLGQAPSGETHLVNQYREKGMTPTGIADKITELDNYYSFSTGLVEKNAIGEGVWQTVERKCSVAGRIKPFDTTRKTRPQILSSLQAALARGELLLHDQEDLMREMRGFHMNKKGKLEGREHDDTVMALAIAYRALNGGSGSASMTIIGEESSGSSGDVDGLGRGSKGGDGVVDTGSSSSELAIGLV